MSAFVYIISLLTNADNIKMSSFDYFLVRHNSDQLPLKQTESIEFGVETDK